MAISRLVLLETAQDLGKPGLAGAILLLAALAYGAAALLPAREELARTEALVRQAAAVQAKAPALPDSPERKAAGEPDAFYQALPAEKDVTQWVERVYETAADQQLALLRGEYVLAPVADTRLTRYRILLPVRGDYLQIRRFVAAAQATIPGLGLEDLNFQRRAIGDSQVDALIRFSLYLAKS